MQELVEDIRENGLFNCVVLREIAPRPVESIPELQHATEYHLCQGERRLRAIQDLWDLGGTLRYDGEEIPEGMIPYVTLGDLDPLRAEICELAENMQREDLTWQEQVAATKRIAMLRSAIAEQEGLPLPTVATIAEEIRGSSEGVHQESTRREIILADLIEKDPEIKAAKNLDDAWKVAKKKETIRRNEVLGESVGKIFSAADHTILHADAEEWLRRCPPERFDVICTDPIYGMGADQFGDSGGESSAQAHSYSDSWEEWIAMVQYFAPESFRVAKPQAHLYAFCDFDNFHEFKRNMLLAGWQVHRTPLIWVKTAGQGRVPWMNPPCGPSRKYELILYACKGKRPVTGIYPDVLSYPPDLNLGHTAQKPVALYADLLKRTCLPGNTALDPFGGSGPLLPAAHGMKVAATIVEKDQGSYGIILNRAKELR